MQIRDGPAAVRGVAPPSEATGSRAGKAAEGGAPSQKTFRAAANPNPSRKEDSCFDDSSPWRLSAALCAVLVPSALAVRVKVRVEGKTTTIFGAGQPTLQAGSNALTALDAASFAGEFYYHVTVTGFGPFVDQIGRYAGEGFSGWSYKINGVAPPVAADQATIKAGDTVLWYWTTFSEQGGSPTLVLKRRAARNCYSVLSQNDQGQSTPAAGAKLRRGRATGNDACRPRMRRQPPRPRTRDGRRRSPVERPPVKHGLLAACALVLLAGCGHERTGSGTATLWITRDRGATVVLVQKVPAGLTAMQALDKKADISTRYGGRYVQSIEDVEGDIGKRRDWFWFLNGIEADRSAADYKLRPGDVEWWDYRSWSGRDARAGRRRRVPRAVPARLGRPGADGGGSLRTRTSAAAPNRSGDCSAPPRSSPLRSRPLRTRMCLSLKVAGSASWLRSATRAARRARRCNSSSPATLPSSRGTPTCSATATRCREPGPGSRSARLAGRARPGSGTPLGRRGDRSRPAPRVPPGAASQALRLPGRDARVVALPVRAQPLRLARGLARDLGGADACRCSASST